MGVSLGDLVEPEHIEFTDLRGKRIGIDALNTIYQFLSSIRQHDGTPLKDAEGRVTSHLSGLFYRTTKWFEHGLKPVYVFDGKPPALKAEESAKRRKRREDARKEYEKLKAAGELEAARAKAAQSSKVTETMLTEAKKLLQGMGVPIIQAPSEGEAQAAHMVDTAVLWACGSQDWDSLLFGAKRMVKNLAVGSASPQKIELDTVLNALDVSREQLVWMGMLMGTDFNPDGVYGYGPKKSLKLVKQCDSLEDVLDEVEWEHENDPFEIEEFFLHPPVNQDATVQFTDPEPDTVRRILVEEHGFSQNRVGNGVERLEAARASTQTGLDTFT